MSINDISFNISQKQTCIDIEHNVSSNCNTAGLYCFNVSYFNYTLAATYIVDFPLATVTGTLDSYYLNCSNQTELELCPQGFYCPDSWTKKSCTPGNFCGYGYASMKPCPFALISCPYSQMYNPNQWAMFFMFAFVLTILLQIYKYLANLSIKTKEFKYKRYTTFDASVTLAAEQETTVQLLGNLAKSRSVRHVLDLNRCDTESVWSNDSVRSNRLWSGEAVIAVEDVPEQPQNPLVSTLATGSTESSQKPRSNTTTSNSSTNNQFANPVSSTFSFEKIKQPLYVSFNKLNLYLKKNNAKVLEEVFGVIKPFNLTALMGPSGAGKTTLLALLRGQAHYARISGLMRVNGVQVSSLVPYREQMAFVPQDDILYEQLSVEDNILFSAILFNKRGYRKPSELLPMVYYAEEVLGIAFIRNSIVGSPERKGISGGQKKRVSTAMEMMKEAALFFLDEPTSGLDSATSISLLHSLHQLSSIGVNIVATLHQPRQEILDLIDNLILLAPGGRLAYFGPPGQLKDHFSQFGYLCPSSSNAADFVMDVLAGFMTPQGKTSSPPVKETIALLCDHWQNVMQPLHEQYLANESNEISTLTKDMRLLHSFSNLSLVEVAPGKRQRFKELMFSWRKTVYVSFSRQKKVYNRGFENIMGASYMLLGAGLVVGYILLPIRLNDSNFQGVAPNLIFQLIVGQLSFGLLTLIWSLQLFSSDELMRNREEVGGVMLFPLMWGKIFASYVELFFFALAFVMGYYSTVEANASFLQYWGLYLLIHMTVASIGNLLTLIVAGKKRDLISMGVLIVLWLFGGIQPAGPQLQSMLPVVGPFLNAISPFRWSFEIQMILELSSYDEVWDPLVGPLYSEFAYHPSNLNLCIGMMIFYWFFVTMLSYLVLVVKRDDFKIITDLREYLGGSKNEVNEEGPSTDSRRTTATGSESMNGQFVRKV